MGRPSASWSATGCLMVALHGPVSDLAPTLRRGCCFRWFFAATSLLPFRLAYGVLGDSQSAAISRSDRATRRRVERNARQGMVIQSLTERCL
jgi:hypothetical protein